MTNETVYGSWKLVSLRFVMTDTGETGDLYGVDPIGYLMMGSDNRMMTVITSTGRESATGEAAEAALFRSMMAYSGPFRIEGGNQFITTVEVSWHPGWVGTEQARSFSVDGDTLLITTAETTHPRFPRGLGRGVLEWRRVSPS